MLFIKHLQYNSIRISEAPEVGGQVSQLGELIGNTLCESTEIEQGKIVFWYVALIMYIVE